jgi:hypothetical protein
MWGVEQASKKYACVQQHLKTHWFTDKEWNAAIE